MDTPLRFVSLGERHLEGPEQCVDGKESSREERRRT
jgi:hypothetical protein